MDESEENLIDSEPLGHHGSDRRSTRRTTSALAVATSRNLLTCDAMTNLIEVRDLVKHFPIKRGLIFQRQIGAVKAVDGISFDVEQGETLGIVGETGCGKSTTARLLCRLMDPTSGSIKFDGREVGAQKGDALKALHRDMQMVFQDPYSSLEPAAEHRWARSSASPLTSSTGSLQGRRRAQAPGSGGDRTPPRTGRPRARARAGTGIRTSSPAASVSGSAVALGARGGARACWCADEPVSALDVSITGRRC